MRTTAEELLGQERVQEMRLWGPTRELSRNDFESDDEGAGNNGNITNGSVELSQSRSPGRHHLTGLIYGRSASLLHSQD